jgi:hypothetical protein
MSLLSRCSHPDVGASGMVLFFQKVYIVLGIINMCPTSEVEKEKGKFLFFFHFVDTLFCPF